MDNKEKKQLTANQFTNVKDIKGIFLYTKDNYIITYLKVFPYNLALLSEEEMQSKTTVLAASFEGDRKDFAYTTYPREIDLDIYKNNLKKHYNEEISNLGIKRILQKMLIEASDLATSGENYEHQHFIKLWKLIGNDRQDTETQLKARINEFKVRYENVGINVEILNEKEIIKMCNLFGNSIHAPFMSVGSNTLYESIPTVK